MYKKQLLLPLAALTLSTVQADSSHERLISRVVTTQEQNLEAIKAVRCKGSIPCLEDLLKEFNRLQGLNAFAQKKLTDNPEEAKTIEDLAISYSQAREVIEQQIVQAHVERLEDELTLSYMIEWYKAYKAALKEQELNKQIEKFLHTKYF